MLHIPEHYRNLSLRLSEVLDDIGVNERMVKKIRRSALLKETLMSLSKNPFNCYIFGSQSEGTTTFGLMSDQDQLMSETKFNVIQDFAEWKPGLCNLLMIQDDITSPGYCHLQLIRPDMPLPVTDILDKHCFRDANGRILVNNTAFDEKKVGGVKNGPARTKETMGHYGTVSVDLVFAMSCESWPVEAKDWSKRCLGKWPTEDMKRYIANSGCFVVPVGSKVSQIEQLEWRISTSKAERCLMYNLNITQIRCFVLLKMIQKTYLQHHVSSYMCKTVLLRCIERTHFNMWQENDLLTCLTICLKTLYTSILYKSCPHFFIPGNNLMAGQFSQRMKDELLKSLQNILTSQGTALYGIQNDDLGERLKIKMNPILPSAHLCSGSVVNLIISGNASVTVAYEVWATFQKEMLNYRLSSPMTVSKTLVQTILHFLRLCKNGTNIEKKILQLQVPLYCSSLGSVLASVNIGTNRSVSPEALNWLSAGMISDVSSGRLKLASVLYCAGDMLRAEIVLKETERFYRLDTVQAACDCYFFVKRNVKQECCKVCFIRNENSIKSAFAYCVKFFPVEMNCIPRELQYELVRSTKEELLHRDVADVWMETAVVDSLPFLYFLQYKTYSNLQSNTDQQRALDHLASTINSDENFGHRETALNLLGQCMQQENRLNDALLCYTTSLNVRGKNNIARYHLCILLADMYSNL